MYIRIYIYIHIFCANTVFLPYAIFIFLATVVSHFSNSNHLITSCWPAFLRVTITQNPFIAIIIIVIIIIIIIIINEIALTITPPCFCFAFCRVFVLYLYIRVFMYSCAGLVTVPASQ